MRQQERDILQQIVDNEGSCTGWANKSVCDMCPMSRLKKRPDGEYYSCFEAICSPDMVSEEEADNRYRDLAVKMLMDAEIEAILSKEPDDV